MMETKKRLRADGERSRRAILETATALASLEGLEGLSIGRLAEHAGMSKSGLYAHFGSKEQLQLAAIATAEEVFRREVREPAAEHPAGRRRILAQADAFLSYLERRVFPGGCFFAAVSNELAGRQGPVADRIRELNEAALADLVAEIRTAQEASELDPAQDADQLAFELDAYMLAAHAWYSLRADPADLERARLAVRNRIGDTDATLVSRQRRSRSPR